MIDVIKDPRYSHIPRKYKKGNCYKDAINYLLGNKNPDLRLCHGWVSGRGVTYGTRFSHAWIENIKTRICIDPSLNPAKPLEIPTIVYYAMGNIIEERVIKYTEKQMLDKLITTAKAGPWENTYDE